MLEEDLDVHQGQPEDLQIDIERTGLELEACYATQAAEEEAIRLWVKIDLEEDIHFGWAHLSSDFLRIKT